MVYCPVCKIELEDGATRCEICGHRIADPATAEWVNLGTIDDKISADFAKETLASYNIPAVVFSKSGFFGNVGLPLNPFYKPSSATFEISVPKEYEEEAVDLLTLTLGEKWQRKDS